MGSEIIAPADSFDFDVVVIGAGPTGLACGIDAKRAGSHVTNIDKGCLVNSLYNYPSNMTFFTTPELLEIGDLPFSSPNQKPTRQEALEYYRKAAEHYQLDVRQYEPVPKVEGQRQQLRRAHHQPARAQARISRAQADPGHRLLRPAELHQRSWRRLAQGHALLPRAASLLRAERADHRRQEFGGHCGAGIVASWRARHPGASRAGHQPSVKYWIKPDIENRIKAGQVNAYFNTSVREITLEHVVLDTPAGRSRRCENDYVFALTGYHPDFEFLCALGIKLSGEADKRPVVDPQTLESNVPGIYLAGVIVAGMRTSEIFIENGRFHGQVIAADLKQKLRADTPTVLRA